MADAVTSQTLADCTIYAVLKFTNISDGTVDGAVTEVDVSAFDSSADGDACSGVVIERIWWQCIGMMVQILWDATSVQFCIELGENQSGNHDYTIFGGLTNNAGAGKNGDIKFTTVGAAVADTYTVILYLRKQFN